MVTYKSTARCPKCAKPANVRFSKREVWRAKRERQAANLQTVQCTRFSCGCIYWIKAHEVAEAVPDRNGGPPERDIPLRAKIALREAGLELSDLEGIEDWTTIPGIGPATARALEAALLPG